MKPTPFKKMFAAALLLTVWLTESCWAKKPADDEIAAIEFLGTVDCYWYPEAQSVLIDTLLGDPREEVRCAAVQALTQQLQRGKSPLDPLSGWREFPDRFIRSQVARIATLRKPLSAEELYERYSKREFEKAQRKGKRRGDTYHDSRTQEVISALTRVAYGKDEIGCYLEPSERIRRAAERALSLCIKPGQVETKAPSAQPPSAAPLLPEAQQVAPGESVALSNRRPIGSLILIAGRADLTNRFNFFDNMGPSPTTRGFFGFQFVQTQNNAVSVTNINERLFQNLTTENGRRAFISFTGFGSGLGTPGGGGDVVVDPTNPDSQKMLEELYLQNNSGGVTREFTGFPDTHLYRFGFEYALTLDFSVAMQAQYVIPLEDVQQPELFSNPLVQAKHVLYRSDETLFSGVLGISPQIPHPQFAIAEKTTRLLPGMLLYHELDEKWFTQLASGFNLPTTSGNIKTWDYALDLGLWLYQHESLKRDYRGPETNKWILGIVQQIEVLGKEIMGSNNVPGQFDLNPNAPLTAEGTYSAVDGTRTIYLPQDPSTAIQNAAIIFEEPRHVVDMTASTSVLFRDNFQLSLGVSFPLTGSQARAAEFLMTLNRSF